MCQAHDKHLWGLQHLILTTSLKVIISSHFAKGTTETQRETKELPCLQEALSPAKENSAYSYNCAVRYKGKQQCTQDCITRGHDSDQGPEMLPREKSCLSKNLKSQEEILHIEGLG